MEGWCHMSNDQMFESLIEQSGGIWHEDVFHIEGSDLWKLLQAAASHYEQENAELAKEAAWIRNKLGLPVDVKLLSGDITLAGTMHNIVHQANGYVRYIEAFKCDDKQGEIARQSVRIAEQEQQIQSLLALVEKQREIAESIFDITEWHPYNSDLVNGKVERLLALQPDSCRLVVIGNISGNDVFLHSDLKGVECCIYRIETIKDSGEQHE
jgi:hypothetical protein